MIAIAVRHQAVAETGTKLYLAGLGILPPMMSWLFSCAERAGGQEVTQLAALQREHGISFLWG